MTKLAYPDLVAIGRTRKASNLGVAILAGAVLLSGLAAEPADAKNRGVAIGVGAFGLGLLLNEAARSEAYGDHEDDDDYSERSYPKESGRKQSYRKESKPRPARKQNNAPEVQFSQEVLETQKSLNQAGYNAGTEDGVGGQQTTAAVKAFQRGFGYQETGWLTAEQRKKLYVIAPEMANTADGGTARETPPAADVPLNAPVADQGSYKPKFATETPQIETKTVAGHENARQIVAEADVEPSTLEVEKALFSLQLITKLPDGRMDDETVEAIKLYQSHFNQSPTGELNAEQRTKLISLAEVYFSYKKNQ
jgi:peptidoglycan hydrolase-like protein with peptidoglycan-binding domain